MKTQYYTASTLDGFVASREHSLEWLFALGDPVESSYDEFFAEIGAMAMGSATYEWLVKNHLRPGTPEEQPWPYEKPVWVFSSRGLDLPENADVKLVQGDVRPVHERLQEEAQGKNVWVVGGGELAGQFYDAGLLDELIIQFAATTLGSGMPVFPRETPAGRLQFQNASPMGNGFVELRYQIHYS
jgi:dihydrofolate reductase